MIGVSPFLLALSNQIGATAEDLCARCLFAVLRWDQD